MPIRHVLQTAARRHLQSLGTAARRHLQTFGGAARRHVNMVAESVRDAFLDQLINPAEKIGRRALYRLKLAVNPQFYKQQVRANTRKLQQRTTQERIQRLKNQIAERMKGSIGRDPERLADLTARAYRAEAGLRQRLNTARIFRGGPQVRAAITAGMRTMRALGDDAASVLRPVHGITVVRPEPGILRRAMQIAQLGAHGTASAFRSQFARAASHISRAWSGLWRQRSNATARPSANQNQRRP